MYSVKIPKSNRYDHKEKEVETSVEEPSNYFQQRDSEDDGMAHSMDFSTSATTLDFKGSGSEDRVRHL
jgi:hypothetical protein